MKQHLKRYSIILVLLIVSVFSLFFLLPKPPLLSGISFSRAIYDDHQHLLRLTLSQDEKYRLYTPLAAMPPQLVAATLLQEDQYFHWHFGVNPFSLFKAGWQTYFAKSRRVGASTITMQVARIRFGINSKTWVGKLKQIVRALQLELHYSKNQILEAYLNLAPYGNNIEGVGAASWIYFAKPVSQINLPEALTLAVIPQNPIQRVPHQKNLAAIRQRLFQRWLVQHPADKNELTIIALPLQIYKLHNIPFLAPHFVNAVLRDVPAKQLQVNTTLNNHLQKMVERVTQQYLARKKSLGIYNAAVLLVDTRNMQIKAMLGSANFFQHDIQGQLNGTEIKRSPGSTLKPFIYGLALDQGLIHPATVLKDVPRSFGHYNPENFDYDFVGPIKARDALVLSRNIPAIYLANQLDQPNLYQFLLDAETRNLKAESYYGLALVLGGAELSMQELVSLYAMLVNEGVWHPLLKQPLPIQESKRLLSPEASFLVLDMLKDTPRPEAAYSSNNVQQVPVSWKTGTSSGFRDAWTIGAFGPYVMAVWVGNFDNTSNPALIGKTMAAPLFFELIAAINRELAPLPMIKVNPQQLNLTRVAVCKASGNLPTRYCHDTEMTWFIPGKSPITTDSIYREVAINKITGLRTCHFDQNTKFAIYEFWPSDLLRIFKEAGVQRRMPPAYEADCALADNKGISPQISSPQTDVSYVVRANQSRSQQIPLLAVADADVRYLYWFIDETFLAKTPRDQPLLWNARAGKFVIRVVDDHGRADARDVMVRVE